VCADDIARWLTEIGLLLNAARMEAVLLGTSAQQEMVPTAVGIDMCSSVYLLHVLVLS